MSDLELHGLEISEENVEKLLEMLGNPETRWYALRRLPGFVSAGLVASTLWNPDLHPRGPDGKFIEKWGFVRWLVDGIWERGRVENILPEGKAIVDPDNDRGNHAVVPINKLYSLPTPKGRITNSPDPTGYSVPDAWDKTGEQGGSNPGGFYTTKETVQVRPSVTSEMIDQVVYEYGESSSFNDVEYKEMKSVYDVAGPPEYFIGLYTDENDTPKMIANTSAAPGLTSDWDAATKANDFKLWVTTSPIDAESARLALTHGMDIDPDTQFYVKQTKSPNHSANEMLANEFYKLAGVPVPDLFFGEHQTVASKILKSSDATGPKPQMLSEVKDDPVVLAQIRQNMTVDAWLANWDVAGMTFDNIIVVDGVPYRIDTGGSLEYRAKGSPKAGMFGNTVGELDTYLNPGTNPSASHVFAGISLTEKRAGGEKVAAISPQKIKDMVTGAGMSPQVADTLIARRADIMDKLDIADPFSVYKPPKLSLIPKGSTSDEMFWNPIDDKWQTGVIQTSAAVLMDQINAELGNLWKAADPELNATVGETVVVHSDFDGLMRVTSVDGAVLKGVSALDPDNKTEYTFNGEFGSRVSEGSEELNSLMLKYRVAVANETLKLQDLEKLFQTAVHNKDSNKPAVQMRVYSSSITGDDLWNMDIGDFVFHSYEDEEGWAHRIIYRVNGISDKSVSLTNVADNRERILTYDEWVDNYAPSQWHFPDQYTQDLTLAMLLRDDVIDQEDTGTTTFENPAPVEAATIGTTPDTLYGSSYPDTDLKTLGITQSMVSENGVNTGLVTTESQVISDFFNNSVAPQTVDEWEELTEGEITDSPWLEMVGQTIILSTPNNENEMHSGIWYIFDGEMDMALYGGEKRVTAKWFLRSPTGNTKTISAHATADTPSSLPDNVLFQTPTALDASIPHAAPTFNKKGEVVYEKTVVGSHRRRYGYYGDYDVILFPQYTVSGARIKMSGYNLNNLKVNLGPRLIPILGTELAPKSAKTKAAKAAMLAYPNFKSRKDFEVGSWVEAPDGFKGVVETVEATSLVAFPDAVKIRDKSGKVRIINANLLAPLDSEPEAPEALVPIADVKAVPVGTPFWPLKLKDGNDPRIGQYVRAYGPGDKITEGTINWVGPPEGKQAKVAPLLSIVTADDKIVRKTLSKTILLKDIKGMPTLPPDGLPENPKAATEILMAFTPEQTSDLGLPYMSDDGQSLQQPQYEKDKWLSGAPGKRTLTKDGYAPRIGMRMRANDGSPLLVTGFKDVFASATSANRVEVWNFAKNGTETRAVSALEVDHLAELFSSDGKPLERIAGLTSTTGLGGGVSQSLPDGTLIYKVSESAYIGGQKRQADVFFYITPEGRIGDMKGGTISEWSSRGRLETWARMGMTKHALIDSTATNYGAYTDSTDSAPAAFIPYDPTEFTHEEALSDHWLSLTKPQVEGSAPPPPIPTENLVHLPKPADAIVVTDDDLSPAPPPVTGVINGGITQTPNSLPVMSITEAAQKVLDLKDSEDLDSGSRYAFGDAEYVEDMMVRAQIAIDQETSKEYVELFFRMPEEKSEATSDLLLTPGGTAIYGKWMPRPDKVFASDLQKGDAITVRKSSMSDMLKPAAGDSPNVRIVADPVLLGMDAKGTAIYRIAIASSDGTTGAVDVEQRAIPSLTVFDWDSHALVSSGNSGKVSVLDKAAQAGWFRAAGIGYDHWPSAPLGGRKSRASTGAKLFQGLTSMSVAGDSNGGARLQRNFPDGSYVRMNAVPSSVGGTSAGELRRWNEVGMVTVRVPVEIAGDPIALEKAITQNLEAVGIPPEKHLPASDEQIARFALNKLHKTHSAYYKHRESAVQEPSMDDPGVTAVLQRMNTELGQILGRQVTFDDIELQVFEDGRLVVLVSKEVAQAMTERQKKRYYKHYFTGNTDDQISDIVDMLGGPTTGVMGGAERYGMGTLIRGKSTETDHSYGSGNRLYMTGMDASKVHGTKPDATNSFLFSPNAINRLLDVYLNDGDGFGKRKQSNDFIRQGYAYEYMVKGKLSPAQIAYYIASSPSSRQAIIDRLLTRGVKEINGRPVEDFVRTGDNQPTLDDDFNDLGTDYGDTVKLPELLKGVIPPVPTNPPEEVPVVEAPAETVGAGI
jgi:hypothetical protein